MIAAENKKRFTRTMRSLFPAFAIIALFVLMVYPKANALILFQSDDFATVTSGSLVLNSDDIFSGDIFLQFGGGLAKTFGWNTAEGRFDLNDTLHIAGDLEVNQIFALTGDITPAQITADQNNYSPSGIDTATVVRLSTDTSRTVRGLTGGTEGRIVIIHNIGPGTLILGNEVGSSLAANRFALGTNMSIPQNGLVQLQYDSTTQRWRAMGGFNLTAGGDLTGTYPNPTINADAVTFAKMQNITSDRLIGRDTASSGDPEEISVANSIVFTGSSSIQLSGDTASPGNSQYYGTDGSGSKGWYTLPDGGGGGGGEISEDFSLSGDLSPSQITANQNNYNPSGISTATVLRLTTDKLRTITGIAGGTDGRILSIINVGSSVIHLSDENASSTAANRLSLSGGDEYLSPSDSVILIYDSTSSRWRSFSYSLLSQQKDPTSRLVMTDEFFTVASTNGWVAGTTGTGASCQTTLYTNNATSKEMGNVECDSGTTATGRATLSLNNNATNIVPALGQIMFGWRVAVNNLSDATNEYDLHIGLHDGIASTGPTDGVYFVYDRNTSTNWRIAASGGGTTTAKTSGTDGGSSAVAAATTWTWLMVVCDSTWSSCDFFSRGQGATTWTWMGNITGANIPTSTELLTAAARILKSAGNTQRNLYLGGFFMYYDTGPR